MATDQISVAGQPVAQLSDYSQPAHGNVLDTPNGNRYRVVRRYEGYGGEPRVHLRSANGVSLFPAVRTVHDWVNEKGWDLYP
jgi:hypothetical protein